MKAQLIAIVSIITNPIATLRRLPADRFYFVGYIIAVYFGVARALRNGKLQMLYERLDSPATFLAIVAAILIVGLILNIAFAAFFKLILRIFKKRVSLRKITNILWYSQAPRLALAIPASLLIGIRPDLLQEKLVLWTMGIGGILLLVYSIALFLIGLKVAAHEPK